ncbi:endoplasmic reticulum metallopeptidase 1-like isoform X1 [Neodiprion pinetum]|uniref:Endoplasmic reticulum metallopeptidase 1 isoform X1 n=2 Tax=Neodiprion lecontei TaxID=441921 RepID=A0ABM3GAN8_NEOLC|nr:endoplasmic reticulum metallopeptidase 1-like isoform X1 [Neodiprion pinetum]XP_046597332.1 endoplasmic reticulum metallopeptidase 1 isoform X1 [Neodiprion lecontei]XP_046620675.1 endoplasmic reticulum metallopeptidase 1-like isoform X1 [Neodiprion virginianus]
MADPKRRTDARYRRTREDPAYSMVKLPRRNEAIYAVTSDSSEYDEERKRKDLIPSLWCGLAILLILLINVTLHHYLYNGLPTPLTVNDLVAGKDLFITERAKSDLIGLAEIGEKVVGSYENEVVAVEYLTNILQEIQAEATNNKTVQIDVARGSGAYFISNRRSFTNVYLNVGNVIARLSDGDNSSVALLVNCHYDSHPSSPGASDNGINCAAMLEVLRVLSQSQTTLTHDIIFLFNGAEENPLQASHAFVTTHRWAADVRAFLNYDSAGFGGREALFQSGPKDPWLDAYYASAVPHPHASAVITDLFESGLVPSDTDFRIFRDFGNLHGLDMAYYAGGHVYHTLYDDYQIIPDGCYQHTGDNMLALIKALGNAPELLESSVEGNSVYYDFLGLFVIRYSTTIAIILNVLTALLALASPFWPTPGCSIKDKAKSLGISFLFQMLGILLGFGLSVFFGMLLDWTDNAMSWYSNPGLLIGLFVVPTMLPMLGVNWAMTAQPIEQVISSRLGTGQRVQLNTQAVGMLWAIILIALTIYGLKSAYVIAIIVGFVSAANIITSILKLQRLVRVWLAIFIGVGLFIPTLYLLWLGSMMTSFLPIMGRSGSDITPDLYISLIMAAITSMIGCFWTPLIAVVRRPQVLVLGFSLAAVITILAATVTTYGFPYTVDRTSPKPQRFWLIHTERTMYDINGNVTYNDGGFWIQNLDRNGPRTVEKYISEYSNATTVADACLDTIYCGLPIWKGRDMGMLNKSFWIPNEVPTVQLYQPSALLGVWNDTTTESRRLYLNLTGPDHMSLVFAPRDGVTLSNWSLLEEVPTSTTWNERSVYFVLHDYAIEPETTVEIWLDLVVSDGVNPVIDISLNAHYVHNTTSASTPYASILKQLPLWVAPLHWSSTYKSYIF